MASLVEELVVLLKEETEDYRKLVEYGEKKRQILIDADVPALEKLTALEQEASDELIVKGSKQVGLLNDIATVLGKEQEQMTVTKLIGCLDSQPKVQAKLMAAKEALIESAKELQEINNINSVLLAQAIEMAEFDITLFKSMRQAPETANYGKDAYNTWQMDSAVSMLEIQDW